MIGNELAMFRSWSEALLTMFVVFLGAALVLGVLFMLWAIGNEVGQLKVWVPLGCFVCGMAVMR